MHVQQCVIKMTKHTIVKKNAHFCFILLSSLSFFTIMSPGNVSIVWSHNTK